MKRKMMFFYLLTTLCLPLCAQDVEPTPKKWYCTANQIEVTDATIFVHLDDATFEADAVQVDQGGIFLTDAMLRCIQCRRPINYKHICECPVAH